MSHEMDLWKEGSLPLFTNQQGEEAPLHFILDQTESCVFTKDIDGRYTCAKIEGIEINTIDSTGKTRMGWSVNPPLYDQKEDIPGLCRISTGISPK